MIAPAAVPIDIDRDEARDAAVRELSRPEYADAHPSLPQRILEWLADRLDFDIAGPVGAPLGVLVILLVIVAVAIAIRLRLGPTLRTFARTAPVLTDLVEPAARYRQAADAAAQHGDFRTAVRMRFRAIARALEERDVLDSRPGRTADEVAADAGARLPAYRTALHDAAASFDAIHYGNRGADAATYARLVDLDAAVSAARSGVQS